MELAFLLLFFCIIVIVSAFTKKYKKCYQSYQNQSFFFFPLLMYCFFILFSYSIFKTISAFNIFPPICSICDLYPSFITIIGANIIFIITLTMIVVELHSTKYTFRVTESIKRYYDFWFLILFNFIFLLLIMYHNPTSQYFLFFCMTPLILTIPFIYNLITYLRPENQITRLLRLIIKKPGDGWLLQNNLQSIFDIIVNAIKNGDIGTAKDGLGKIMGDNQDDGLERAREIIRKEFVDDMKKQNNGTLDTKEYPIIYIIEESTAIIDSISSNMSFWLITADILRLKSTLMEE